MTDFSKTAPGAPCETLLSATLDYCRRGWSLVPMAMAKKRPARKWKEYQTKRASESQLREWFGSGSQHGIGVVFGAVSGGLASRDFDTLDAYETWAEAHPELARILPTVATRRGRHVYSIAAPGSIEAVRAALGKPGTGAIAFDDGELRAGVGCYSVLPPSIHPSGRVYRWLIPLGEQIPVVDLQAAGFLGEVKGNRASVQQSEPMQLGGQQIQQSHNPQLLHQVSEVSKSSELSALSLLHGAAPSASSTRDDSSPENTLAERMQAAIERTLPEHPGQRHKRLFDFARELKALPEMAAAPLNQLRPHVRRWHSLSLPFIATKAWDDSWLEFCSAWQRVKYPAGQEPILTALERAKAADPPEGAAEFEQPALRLLIALCRELQRIAGDEPFFLDARKAGELLGIDHTKAWRWLRQLCDAEILLLVSSGSREKRQANRYQYAGPL